MKKTLKKGLFLITMVITIYVIGYWLFQIITIPFNWIVQ